MKRRFGIRAVGAALLAVLTLAVVFWPQRFSDFAQTDQAEFLCVAAFDRRVGMEHYEVNGPSEELDRALAPLGHGRLW